VKQMKTGETPDQKNSRVGSQIPLVTQIRSHFLKGLRIQSQILNSFFLFLFPSSGNTRFVSRAAKLD
jgi:hypothetical protein